MLERSGTIFVFTPSKIEAKTPQFIPIPKPETHITPVSDIQPKTHQSVSLHEPQMPQVNKSVTQRLEPTKPVPETQVNQPQKNKPNQLLPSRKTLGIALLGTSIASILFLFGTQVRLEIQGRIAAKELTQAQTKKSIVPMPKMVSPTFNPLIGADGNTITPVNTDFAIIIPKFNINSPVIGSVNPFDAKEYGPILKKGVAHAKTSYFPNQDGSVYLFSHSTNYEWFVRDLNALFYNVKDLTDGDYVIIFYQGVRYTYEYKSREIVAPKNTAFILPVTGKRQLILQTCWPPGSTTQRLLIFADLIDVK